MHEIDQIVPGAFSCVPSNSIEDVSQRMHDRSAKNNGKFNINLNRVAIPADSATGFW